MKILLLEWSQEIGKSKSCLVLMASMVHYNRSHQGKEKKYTIKSFMESYWKYQKKKWNEYIKSALLVFNDANFIALWEAISHKELIKHHKISGNSEPLTRSKSI